MSKMSTPIDDGWVIKRLQMAVNTQENIQSLSQWAMSHKTQHEKIVKLWFKVLSSVKIEQRLVLFYLCNEVVQTCKKRHAVMYKDAFKEVLHEATILVRDASVRRNIERIFEIWRERAVYDEEFMAHLTSLLRDDAVEVKAAEGALANFKADDLFEMVRRLIQLEADNEERRSGIYEVPISAQDVERNKRPLKDRNQTSEYVEAVKYLREELKLYLALLNGERMKRTSVIENLEQAERYYDEQNREAGIVANAYKAFGARVNTMKKRLNDVRRRLGCDMTETRSSSSAETLSSTNLPHNINTSAAAAAAAADDEYSGVDSRQPLESRLRGVFERSGEGDESYSPPPPTDTSVYQPNVLASHAYTGALSQSNAYLAAPSTTAELTIDSSASVPQGSIFSVAQRVSQGGMYQGLGGIPGLSSYDEYEPTAVNSNGVLSGSLYEPGGAGNMSHVYQPVIDSVPPAVSSVYDRTVAPLPVSSLFERTVAAPAASSMYDRPLSVGAPVKSVYDRAVAPAQASGVYNRAVAPAQRVRSSASEEYMGGNTPVQDEEEDLPPPPPPPPQITSLTSQAPTAPGSFDNPMEFLSKIINQTGMYVGSGSGAGFDPWEALKNFVVPPPVASTPVVEGYDPASAGMTSWSSQPLYNTSTSTGSYEATTQPDLPPPPPPPPSEGKNKSSRRKSSVEGSESVLEPVSSSSYKLPSSSTSSSSPHHQHKESSHSKRKQSQDSSTERRNSVRSNEDNEHKKKKSKKHTDKEEAFEDEKVSSSSGSKSKRAAVDEARGHNKDKSSSRPDRKSTDEEKERSRRVSTGSRKTSKNEDEKRASAERQRKDSDRSRKDSDRSDRRDQERRKRKSEDKSFDKTRKESIKSTDSSSSKRKESNKESSSRRHSKDYREEVSGRLKKEREKSPSPSRAHRSPQDRHRKDSLTMADGGPSKGRYSHIAAKNLATSSQIIRHSRSPLRYRSRSPISKSSHLMRGQSHESTSSTPLGSPRLSRTPDRAYRLGSVGSGRASSTPPPPPPIPTLMDSTHLDGILRGMGKEAVDEKGLYIEDPSLVSATPYYVVIEGITYLVQPATEPPPPNIPHTLPPPINPLIPPPPFPPSLIDSNKLLDSNSDRLKSTQPSSIHSTPHSISHSLPQMLPPQLSMPSLLHPQQLQPGQQLLAGSQSGQQLLAGSQPGQQLLAGSQLVNQQLQPPPLPQLLPGQRLPPAGQQLPPMLPLPPPPGQQLLLPGQQLPLAGPAPPPLPSGSGMKVVATSKGFSIVPDDRGKPAQAHNFNLAPPSFYSSIAPPALVKDAPPLPPGPPMSLPPPPPRLHAPPKSSKSDVAPPLPPALPSVPPPFTLPLPPPGLALPRVSGPPPLLLPPGGAVAMSRPPPPVLSQPPVMSEGPGWINPPPILMDEAPRDLEPLMRLHFDEIPFHPPRGHHQPPPMGFRSHSRPDRYAEHDRERYAGRDDEPERRVRREHDLERHAGREYDAERRAGREHDHDLERHTGREHEVERRIGREFEPERRIGREFDRERRNDLKAESQRNDRGGSASSKPNSNLKMIKTVDDSEPLVTHDNNSSSCKVESDVRHISSAPIEVKPSSSNLIPLSSRIEMDINKTVTTTTPHKTVTAALPPSNTKTTTTVSPPNTATVPPPNTTTVPPPNATTVPPPNTTTVPSPNTTTVRHPSKTTVPPANKSVLTRLPRPNTTVKASLPPSRATITTTLSRPIIRPSSTATNAQSDSDLQAKNRQAAEAMMAMMAEARKNKSSDSGQESRSADMKQELNSESSNTSRNIFDIVISSTVVGQPIETRTTSSSHRLSTDERSERLLAEIFTSPSAADERRVVMSHSEGDTRRVLNNEDDEWLEDDDVSDNAGVIYSQPLDTDPRPEPLVSSASSDMIIASSYEPRMRRGRGMRPYRHAPPLLTPNRARGPLFNGGSVRGPRLPPGLVPRGARLRGTMRPSGPGRGGPFMPPGDRFDM